MIRTFRIGRVLSALLILLLSYGAYFYFSYPGLVYAIRSQLQYATWSENILLFRTVSYWVSWVDRMRFNEGAGLWSLDGVEEDRLDDFEKGQLAYHQGKFPSAAAYLKKYIEDRGESQPALFWLAMSYMREAEAQNCLSKLIAAPGADTVTAFDGHSGSHHASMCSLPLSTFHDHDESARTAAAILERLLDHYDPANRLYQWLLNFNYMTVDGFPHDVPPKHLIRSEFIDFFNGERSNEIRTRYAYLQFQDRAKELNVDTYNAGKGVAVEDFDKDGYLDIVTGGTFSELRYYENLAGTTFVDRTREAGLGGVMQAHIITAADYDNDGWIDLFVSQPFGRFSLLRNKGDGTFRDVTAPSGLLEGVPADTIASTWVSAWTDVENDGDLDVFVANWGMQIPFATGLLAKPTMDSVLFINEKGHFVDRTQEYGLIDIVKDQNFSGAASGDYDADGYPDLFLSSPLPNESILLKNISGRRFEKTDLLLRTPPGFMTAFVDLNHDGKLDIFLGGFGNVQSVTERVVFGEHAGEYQSGRSAILLQTPDGKFEERRDFFQDEMPVSTMGASFGDLDNDGCYDFYLGTGSPDGWFVLPNLMYIGQRDGTGCTGRLINISNLFGFGTIQKGHGIVFFDFDNDGKQDIYSSLGGMFPGDAWPNQFFVNQSKLDSRWVKIRLRGRRTNYFGVGARIKVVAETQGGEQIERHYLMDQKTGFGSGPYLAHIGLAEAARIKSVEVFWPVSGHKKSYPAELQELNILDEDTGTLIAP